jgi:predicted O-linked N-acetylglucosamine transferase (SPINDLY family)
MPDDGSDSRKRLAAAFDELADVGSLTVRNLTERIRRDRIDILVDLSGWTQHARPESLALRCAPVQVNWLGYPGTMGHKTVADYILGDPVVTPAGDADYYTETIAQLPFCYLPADTTWRPENSASRLAEGLPESGFVFCSLNGSQKYNPPLFDLWCGLLRETPGSVLWLSDPGATGADALRQEAIRRDVQAERLVFAKRVDSKGDHLTRIALADLGLDPFPYNSHSTGIDTLWAGVPLLALRGQTFAGRVGASMLLAAGLDSLVAETPEQYREIALDLYRDRQRLDALRKHLDQAKQSAPLFDMARFTRSLEDVYARMWENHRTGNREPILADDPRGMLQPAAELPA